MRGEAMRPQMRCVLLSLFVCAIWAALFSGQARAQDSMRERINELRRFAAARPERLAEAPHMNHIQAGRQRSPMQARLDSLHQWANRQLRQPSALHILKTNLKPFAPRPQIPKSPAVASAIPRSPAVRPRTIAPRWPSIDTHGPGMGRLGFAFQDRTIIRRLEGHMTDPHAIWNLQQLGADLIELADLAISGRTTVGKPTFWNKLGLGLGVGSRLNFRPAAVASKGKTYIDMARLRPSAFRSFGLGALANWLRRRPVTRQHVATYRLSTSDGLYRLDRHMTLYHQKTVSPSGRRVFTSWTGSTREVFGPKAGPPGTTSTFTVKPFKPAFRKPSTPVRPPRPPRRTTRSLRRR